MGNSEFTLDELTIFRHFIEASGLNVDPDSIKQCSPPYPDVYCELKSGEVKGFEITEASNPSNVRFIFTTDKVSNLICERALNLPDKLYLQLKKRSPVSFGFNKNASENQIKNEIDKILLAILEAPRDNDNSLQEICDRFPKVLKSLRYAGRCDSANCFNFNISYTFDHSDATKDAVRRKLKKRYVENLSIDLIVMLNSFSAHFLGEWREEIPKLLSLYEGNNPFDKIWIFGDGIEATYNME